jgi:hypothetical protein
MAIETSIGNSNGVTTDAREKRFRHVDTADLRTHPGRGCPERARIFFVNRPFREASTAVFAMIHEVHRPGLRVRVPPIVNGLLVHPNPCPSMQFLDVKNHRRNDHLLPAILVRMTYLM